MTLIETQIQENLNAAAGYKASIEQFKLQSPINSEMIAHYQMLFDRVSGQANDLKMQVDSDKRNALYLAEAQAAVAASTKTSSDMQVSSEFLPKDSRPQITNNYSTTEQPKSNSSLILIALAFIAVIFFGVLK